MSRSSFDECAAPALGLDREYHHLGKVLPVPNSIRRMRSLSGTLQMMSDDATGVTLERWRDRLPDVDAILNGGHGYAFYRAVEATKIDLSTVHTGTLAFSRAGVHVSGKLERSQLEELLRPSMEIVAQTLDRALTTAGVQPSEVDLVLRTGGSSQIPAFVRLLEERFGPDRVHQRDAFATVALGLGVHAANLWRK